MGEDLKECGEFLRSHFGIHIPKKNFKELPKKFSSTSKIVKITPEDFIFGMAFSDVSEIEGVFRAYSKLLREIPLYDAIRHTDDDGLMYDYSPEKVIEEIKKCEEKRGKDFDGITFAMIFSNLAVDKIYIEKTGDKYIVEIDNKKEKKIAEALGKKRIVHRSSAHIKMSVVDDWWYNVDLYDVLKNIPVSEEDAGKLARYFFTSCFSYPKYEGATKEDIKKFEHQELVLSFEYKGRKLGFEARLDNPGLGQAYFRTWKGDLEKKVFTDVRGKNVVGCAWSWVKPIIRGPILQLELKNEKYPSIEEGEFLQEARDYLIQRIKAD